MQLQSKTILEFINYINNKNVTAQFQIDNSFIQPQVTSESPGGFELEMDIFIPQMQKIVYVPTVLETIKRAWIQYLAILIPIFFLVHKVILGLGFKLKILKAYESNDIRDEVLTYEKGYMYSKKF